MINLVIPMAGLGSRFSQAGYSRIKPLLPIEDKLMISVVLNNLASERLSRVVIVTREEIMQELIQESFVPNSLSNKISLVGVSELPKGPAETAYLAKKYIDPELPVVFANSDQFLVGGIEGFYRKLLEIPNGGILITSSDSDPKWSFVEFDDTGKVVGIREKKPVSETITVGIYGFDNFHSFESALNAARANKDTVNNEYYVGPLYNSLISESWQLHIQDCGDVGKEFFGLGIPDDLNLFLSESEIAQSATDFLTIPHQNNLSHLDAIQT